MHTIAALGAVALGAIAMTIHPQDPLTEKQPNPQIRTATFAVG